MHNSDCKFWYHGKSEHFFYISSETSDTLEVIGFLIIILISSCNLIFIHEKVKLYRDLCVFFFFMDIVYLRLVRIYGSLVSCLNGVCGSSLGKEKMCDWIQRGAV